MGSEVRFPEMRNELQYAVYALADERFQERAWSEGPDPGLGVTYTFDMALHALLDDSLVADRGEVAIGLVLKNDTELRAVLNLIGAARRLIDEIGLQGTFNDARFRPSWEALVAAASRAASVLGSPTHFP
jgi:hypothetical protein